MVISIICTNFCFNVFFYTDINFFESLMIFVKISVKIHLSDFIFMQVN